MKEDHKLTLTVAASLGYTNQVLDVLSHYTKADIQDQIDLAITLSIVSGMISQFDDLYNAGYTTSTPEKIINYAATVNNINLLKNFQSKGIDLSSIFSFDLKFGTEHREITDFLIHETELPIPVEFVSKLVKLNEWDLVQFLIEKKNAPIPEKLLQEATKDGATDLVKYLVDSKKSEPSITLFRSAAQNGHIDIAYYLKDKIPDLSTQAKLTRNIVENESHTCALLLRLNIFDANVIHEDDYIKLEEKLLARANPLVYNVRLKDIEKYEEASKEFKGMMQMMLLMKQGDLPSDLFNRVSANYNQHHLDLELISKLNFPTKEEIKAVPFECSLLAKTWIALLEKNQVAPAVQKD